MISSLAVRLARSLAAALALAGSTAWLAPTVQAASSSCSFGGSSSTCSLATPFEKIVTADFELGLELTRLPTLGAGTIQFLEQEGVFVVDVDFIPFLGSGTGTGMLDYKLSINPLSKTAWYFDEAGLAIIGPPVRRLSSIALNAPQFQSTTAIFNNNLSVLSLHANQDNTFQTGSFSTPLSTISVSNRYAVSRGSINNFQHSFVLQDPPQSSVPGPVPLLGAAAYYAASRRLRRRVRISGPK